MSTPRLVRFGLVAAVVVGIPLDAQQVRVQTSYFAEAYNFDPGLSFKRVEQYTWPVGISASFGRYADLAISTGYVVIHLESAVPNQLSDQRLAGALDTEIRLSYNVIPGQLVIFGTGKIPTGIQTVEQQELSILGAIASDLISFTATTLGSGGVVGGGFAGAMPVGSFALGVSGTFTNPLSYTPVVGDADALKPGAEVRLRAGLEGSLGRRTYLRTAVIWSSRRQDAVGAQTQNGIGNRIIGYASVSHGLGPGQAVVYGFDVFRATPTLEPGLAGAAVLPRGNLIAVGGRYDWPVMGGVSLAPRVEFRLSAAARSASDPRLRLLGQSVRFGVDVRKQLGRQFTVAVQGDGVTGFVVQSGEHIGFDGFRVSLQGEWRP